MFFWHSVEKRSIRKWGQILFLANPYETTRNRFGIVVNLLDISMYETVSKQLDRWIPLAHSMRRDRILTDKNACSRLFSYIKSYNNLNELPQPQRVRKPAWLVQLLLTSCVVNVGGWRFWKKALNLFISLLIMVTWLSLSVHSSLRTQFTAISAG